MTAPLFIRSGSAILMRAPLSRPTYTPFISQTDHSSPARRDEYLDAVLDVLNENVGRFNAIQEGR